MAADMAIKVILTLGGTSIFKGDPVELFVRDVIAFAAHPTHSGKMRWVHTEVRNLEDQDIRLGKQILID